jgi:hypothetical protein
VSSQNQNAFSQLCLIQRLCNTGAAVSELIQRIENHHRLTTAMNHGLLHQEAPVGQRLTEALPAPALQTLCCLKVCTST